MLNIAEGQGACILFSQITWKYYAHASNDVANGTFVYKRMDINDMNMASLQYE